MGNFDGQLYSAGFFCRGDKNEDILWGLATFDYISYQGWMIDPVQ